MATLEFNNAYEPTYDRYQAVYERLLRRVQTLLKLNKNAWVEVTLTDDPTVHKLNRQYRGVDRTTDVLSFSFSEHHPKDAPFKRKDFTALGMIVISIPKAKAQSEEYGHSLERELSFLFIHGMLHLLGYDHHTPADEKTMIALQDRILGKRVPQ